MRPQPRRGLGGAPGIRSREEGKGEAWSSRLARSWMMGALETSMKTFRLKSWERKGSFFQPATETAGKAPRPGIG